MEKIDFFGGLHGNFLELLINLFIYQIDVDPSQSLWFNSNGACHIKDTVPSYIPKIIQGHYSFNNEEFDPSDLVIEIHASQDYMLPALTNSLVRAGDQIFDISYLETDTISKLAALPKAKHFLQDLITEHGEKENYPRSVIRNYFYANFESPEFGIEKFNNFKHKGKRFQFPLRAFYDIEQLYLYLNQCAFFLNMNFYPNDRTYQIWQEFIQHNQGYHSFQKCNLAIKNILGGTSMYIGDFNLVEEAWILHRLATIFRCYDHPLINLDRIPVDTKQISEIVYRWKSNDRLDCSVS